MGSEVLSALTTDRLRVEQEGEILTVTATSPATFNAQNRAMLLDLNRAFAEVERMRPLREAVNQVLSAQPDAVRETKQLLTEASELPLDTANMLECRAFASRMGRDELRVGMEAMMRARDRSIPPP